MTITQSMLQTREQIALARNTFASLDWYGRWCLATGGTAFTTYEDLGDLCCVELNRLAKSWLSSGGEAPAL